MLDFPVDGGSRWVLYGLLIVWAALLVFGFVLGKPDRDNSRRLPLGARMGMSVALVIAAFVWWRAGTASTSLARFGLFVFLGMASGFVGDLFMAGLIVPKPRNVIFGILSFGIGHVFYILGFVQAAAALGLDLGQVAPITLAVYLTIAVILWLAFVRSPGRGRTMNLGTLGYSLLLSAMGATAMALALQNGGFIPLAFGGLCFIASDLILGSQIMRGSSFRSIGDVIWIAYTIAQMLIVYSSSPALRLLGQVN